MKERVRERRFGEEKEYINYGHGWIRHSFSVAFYPGIVDTNLPNNKFVTTSNALHAV